MYQQWLKCFLKGKNQKFYFGLEQQEVMMTEQKKLLELLLRLLHKANVDFAVLGTEESSTGDAAKRAGNEFLFQMQAISNIEILNSYRS